MKVKLTESQVKRLFKILEEQAPENSTDDQIQMIGKYMKGMSEYAKDYIAGLPQTDSGSNANQSLDGSSSVDSPNGPQGGVPVTSSMAGQSSSNPTDDSPGPQDGGTSVPSTASGSSSGVPASPAPASSYNETGDAMALPLGEPAIITSPFGPRRTRHGNDKHEGVDFESPSGAKVYATADGTVIAAGAYENCGGMVKIKHEHPPVITKFCHLRQWSVLPGKFVKMGQLIGLSGGGPNDPIRTRGNATGPCLHYEIRDLNNIPLNPTDVQTNLAIE